MDIENMKDKELDELEVKVKKEREARKRKGSEKEVKKLKSEVKKLESEYSKLCKEFGNPKPIELKVNLHVAFKPNYDDFYGVLDSIYDDDIFYTTAEGGLVEDKKLSPKMARIIKFGINDVLENACDDLEDLSPFCKKRDNFMKKWQEFQKKWAVLKREFNLKIEDLKG